MYIVGGVVYATASSITFSKGTFAYNQAYQQGGVAALESQCRLTVNGSTLDSNSGPYGGAFVIQGNSHVSISDVHGLNNSAPYGGIIMIALKVIKL